MAEVIDKLGHLIFEDFRYRLNDDFVAAGTDSNHLAAFNAEASRVNSKWKKARTTDGLGAMKESDFPDRLVAISVIGKNVKTELVHCLNRRNGCGHPNTLKVGPNTVVHHLEVLLLNVFQKFC